MDTTDSPTSYSRNTTLTIILVLLVIIVIIIIYNYWNIYTNIPCRSGIVRATEGYCNNTSNDQKFVYIAPKPGCNTMGKVILDNRNTPNNNTNNHRANAASGNNLINNSNNSNNPNNSNNSNNVNNPNSTPTSQSIKSIKSVKSNLPENGVTKFIIYHMEGCGHCSDIMKHAQQNGKTKFEQLCDTFKNNKKVQILDFKHGTDKEAEPFKFFPTIHIVTANNGPIEYNGSRDVASMAKAISEKTN